MLVALASVDDSLQHSRLRRLVGRADLLPGGSCGLESRPRAFEISLGEPDLTERQLEGPLQLGRAAPVHLIVISDLLELGCGGARTCELAGSERDLDLGGEQARAGERIDPFARQLALDRGCRGVDLALRETEE